MIRKPDFVDECYKDSDLSLLKKLTLVIPTYNRNFYLSRCLWYHAHFPFGQIIVADSSPEEIKTKNRDIIKKIREKFSIDVVYLEYRPETDRFGGDIYKKWGDAALHVTTEYAEICTDKEFLIPTRCNKSIEFLSQNPDYINTFANRGDAVIPPNKKIINIDSYHHQAKTYEEENPIDRLAAFNNDCNIIENIFQIYKTDKLKNIYKNLINFRIDDIRFGEMYLEMQPFILGKIRQDCTIGRIRDGTNISFTDENQAPSSSSQYVFLDKYPEERINQFQKKLSCLLFESLNSENKTEENQIKIKDICFNVAWWWMCANNTKENAQKYKSNKIWMRKNIRKKYPLIKQITDMIWDRLPQSLKHEVYEIIGTKTPASQPIVDINDEEIQVIIKCISSDLKY